MTPRRGAILLEAVVGLAVVALAGTAALGVAQAAVQAASNMASREREQRAAEELLTAYTLASAAELEQRVGTQRIGAFLIHVQRPQPGLFRLSVASASQPQAELLVTVTYRPQS